MALKIHSDVLHPSVTKLWKILLVWILQLIQPWYKQWSNPEYYRHTQTCNIICSRSIDGRFIFKWRRSFLYHRGSNGIKYIYTITIVTNNYTGAEIENYILNKCHSKDMDIYFYFVKYFVMKNHFLLYFSSQNTNLGVAIIWNIMWLSTTNWWC